MLDIPPDRQAEGGDTMEVKKCPFCGGTPKLIHVYDHNLFVIRHTCRSFGKPALLIDTVLLSSKDEAIEVWNRRAKDG